MRRGKRFGWLGVVLAAVALAGCAAPDQREVLFQTSTINALMEGLYDGNLTVADLLKHGDLGIGTFEGLDGEMVVLDGRVYQVRSDGRVYQPAAEATTPFASVTFFRPRHTVVAKGPVDLAELEALLDAATSGRSVPLAVRIEGEFRFVKTRSVPRQVKPYPPLVDVTARQPTFEMRDVKGVLVGFRFPEYITGINVPGWHLHFLTDDRQRGGHVLEIEGRNLRAEIGEPHQLWVSLPEGADFAGADIGRDRGAEIHRAEK
jgi:acetolactate decarboxylase